MLDASNIEKPVKEGPQDICDDSASKKGGRRKGKAGESIKVTVTEDSSQVLAASGDSDTKRGRSQTRNAAKDRSVSSSLDHSSQGKGRVSRSSVSVQEESYEPAPVKGGKGKVAKGGSQEEPIEPVTSKGGKGERH